MRRLCFIFFLLFFVATASFSVDPEELGIELYMRGLDAYQSGDYGRAQKLMEEAMKVYPNIESKVKDFKLIFGICAFYNGDYDKAKTYLSIYKDKNEIARKLLSEIPTETEEDFLKYLEIPKESTGVETSLSTEGKKSERSSGKSLILLMGIFTVLFSGFLFLDLKFHIVGRVIERFQKVKRVEIEEGETRELNVEMEGKVGDEMVETARSNEPLDVEELSRKEIGVVEDLLRILEEVETLSEKAISVGEGLKTEVEGVQTATAVVEREAETESPFSPERIRRMVENLEKEMEKGKSGVEEEEDEGWIDANEANLTVEERLQKLEEKENYTSEEILKMLELISRAENEEEKS